MRPWLRALPVLLGLTVLAAVLIAAGRDSAVPSRVYTAGEVRAGLARHPQAWLNRTLLVRGVAGIACCHWNTADASQCAPAQAILGAAGPGMARAALGLAWAGPDPLLTVVRRMPLLGRLVPAPAVIRWGVLATYWVQLRAVAGGPCGGTTCYEAFLTDATPELGEG
jgi:hypothetical protein